MTSMISDYSYLLTQVEICTRIFKKNMALVFRGSVYCGSHIREGQHDAKTSSQAQVDQFHVASEGHTVRNSFLNDAFIS
jgi:hypothetical protein